MWLIPYQVLAAEDGAGNTRPDVVCRPGPFGPGFTTNRNHAAVAAAQAAPHRSFYGDLRRALEFRSDVRNGFKHRLGATAVNHDVRPAFELAQVALQRHRDAAIVAG